MWAWRVPHAVSSLSRQESFLPSSVRADESAPAYDDNSGREKRDAKSAVLPVGSFEQHDDYLPLVTDTVIAAVISRELSSAYPLLQLPPVTISCSHEHSAWHGTVSISASTLHSMVNDIYCSIASSGLTALVILNCHEGNYVLANVVQEGNAQGKKMALSCVRQSGVLTGLGVGRGADV
jgi:creatinine amidohydrolase/Fe(II)-dependent formamide hydrolase-like protein